MSIHEAWVMVLRNSIDELNKDFDNYLSGLITWDEYCDREEQHHMLMRIYHDQFAGE